MVQDVRHEIKKSVSLHGVALEIAGRGILITGASGIGKTTSAMRAMVSGYFWIADDLAVINKDSNGALIMTGHKKIKKYLHTEQTGIIEVNRVLPPSWIKSKTRLDGIIDVVRTDGEMVCYGMSEEEILEKRLPCFRISIPRTGYFNQNLLDFAAKKLHEVG